MSIEHILGYVWSSSGLITIVVVTLYSSVSALVEKLDSGNGHSSIVNLYAACQEADSVGKTW